MTNRLLTAATAALALLCSACGAENHYEVNVRVRPEGGVERSLRIQRNGSPESTPRLAGRERARLERVYGPLPDGAGPVELSGQVDGKVPGDLAGHGGYARRNSPFGALHAYVERFGGTDDLGRVERRRRKGVKNLAQLIRGWLTSELRSHPRFAHLKLYLDTHLEPDLDNISRIIVLPMMRQDQTAALADTESRLRLYLFEHGYTMDVSPLSATAFFREFLGELRRLLRRVLQVPDGAADPPQLSFLADEERVEASVTKFVRTTRAFRRYRIEAARRGLPDPIHEEDGVSGVVMGVLLEALALDGHFLEGDPQVTVRLACPSEPCETNGVWNAETGIVTWKGAIVRAGWPSPVFRCTWTVPDAEAQRAAFGRVILEDDTLEYVISAWNRLDARDRAAWSGFAAGLRPKTATTQLDAFCDHVLDGEDARVSLHMLACAVQHALSPAENSPVEEVDDEHDDHP